MMNFDIEDGLLSGFLTLVRCLFGTLPYNVRDLLTTWETSLIMAIWKGFLA